MNCLAFVALAAGSLASGDAQAQADVPALVSTAKEKYQPISPDEVAAAKQELATAAQSLERYLRPQSSNGQKWLAYLKWEAFQSALSGADLPSFEPLVATYNQLNKDEPGLELKPFRRLSAALRNYIDFASMARQKDQADVYGRQLDALSAALDKYRANPSADLAGSIGQRLDLLTGWGQAPELVDAVRAEFAQPNAFVTVSADLLQDAAKPIDRHEPITDCILGVFIRGNGHTTGTANLHTVPNDRLAVIELVTDGRVVSQNRGYKDPAVIRSTSYTDFAATQLVEFSDTRFRALTPRVSASTSSRIHSVSKAGGGMGSRLVSNIGMQKAHEKQGQANRIAAEHAEERIARKMTDEVDEKLGKAWNRFNKDYRLPLERRGELPQHMHFSTTASSLDFQATQANRSQLAAPSAAPELPAADLVARVHETAINNYVAALLSGATISEANPDDGTQADVTLPPFIKDAWKNRMDEKAEDAPDSEFEPWSLTFRRERPITVSFVDGNVTLTLHIRKLKSGADTFDNWDVTAAYTPELVDGGVKLTRAGELTVLPTGFDPSKGGLGSRDVAVRSNLTKVLTERSDQGRGIPQTIQVDQIEPKDDLAHVGPLPVKEFNSGAGWLTVAWNRE
jgi:hypothetical protein